MEAVYTCSKCSCQWQSDASIHTALCPHCGYHHFQKAVIAERITANMSQVKWEYEVTHAQLYASTEEMCARGELGWELVSEQAIPETRYDPVQVRTVWKRRKDG